MWLSLHVYVQVMTMTRPEVAEFLLGLGANPNETDPDVGRTPLHDAAEHGHEDTVECLLRYGADPKLIDCIRGNTPAHLAAGEGRPVRVSDHGPSINHFAWWIAFILN